MSTATVEVESLPSLPVHALKPGHTTTSFVSDHPTREAHALNRSASYTSIPGLVGNAQGIKRTFSENVLSSLAPKPTKITPSMQNANVELFRRASQKTKKRMSTARFVSLNEIEDSERAGRSIEMSDTLSLKSQGRAANALKMFSRKNWLSAPRPDSPPKHDDHERDPQPARKQSISPTKLSTREIAMPEPVATRISPRSSHTANPSEIPTLRENGLSRKHTSSPTPTSRTISEYSVETEIDSEADSKRVSRRSSLSSLRSRPSIDKIEKMYLTVPSSKVPPIPPSISPDRLSSQSSDTARKKDPHWITFRSIDGEYTSFHAKTGLQKAKVIRTVFLPFLCRTSDRIVTHSLRAEDLDRRAVILNKWWTGLLDLLNGTGQQSISGTDRPAFLEAICELMVRHEWKIPPFPSSPTEPVEAYRTSSKPESSSSSTDSEEPDFLVRSIHQNVRNMFVQNILQQMTFVVDKLSMRAAPASLVIFGGKTCAYAFFYCPGVADMLARLWHIPPGTLRRLFAEYGPDSGRKAGIVSKTLGPCFPPPLRSLTLTSYATLSRRLQNRVQIPSNTAHIRWHGPWVSRWLGRDSDLFFVFVKHYHLLVAEYLPRHLLPEERMGVPGLAVVHAQVLLNLESALYRQAGHFAAEHYASSAGDNPDAMAPLPMVIPNATRSVGENRLVMLLKDVVGDMKPENVGLAEVLVGSFQYILKAAVRKVSMYNNDACFVLCDFLEELVPLVTKYQRMHVEEEDWCFWLNVYKQMMQSQSTMTQIRVIAFLYSTWPLLVIDDTRKRQLVLEWLLEPQFFVQFFNHWSPMVRHYYFRLLCWRVGRNDGAASEVDLEIYQQLTQLLNKLWAHHQYLTADAEMRGILPPSVNPCSPAPGRALLIIRMDTHARPGDFTSFDKFMPLSTNQSSSYNSHSSILNKVPEADYQQTNPKKRWSLLKTIGLFSSPANNRPGEVTPPGSPDSLGDTAKTKPSTSHASGARDQQGTVSRPASPPHQALNFRFSLEYTNNRPTLPIKPRRLPPPTIPHTSQKLLNDLNKLEQMSSVENLALAIKEIKPLKPRPEEMSAARYSGRALSEWAQVVSECRSFYLRRKQEGVPRDGAVETPCIAVESFRMFG